MLDFFVKGGIVMIPLALCSIAALTIIIERILFYSRASKWEERETKLVKVYLTQGKIADARAITANWNSSLGRIAETALKQWTEDRNLLEQALENTGTEELKKFERGLAILDTIVTASPLLGLLGTVTGIIKAFSALSMAGGNPAQLSLGIAEALYTTAFGLAIAIPTMFFINAFYSIIEKQARKLTVESQQFISILQRNAGENDEVRG